MRRLLLALAAVAGVLLQTGVAQAAPVLHLSGWKATAGKPETFTITRVGGSGAATVLFKTADGTAVAGPDYAATSQTISWAPGQTRASVQVATFINMAKAGRSISFTATIMANGATSSATGLIVEPALPAPPPPPTPTPHPCNDVSGSGPLFVVPGSNCPARMCPSYPNPVPWEQPCPAPPITTAPFSIGSLVTRQGLVYRIADDGIDDPFVIGGGRIYGVRYVSDTTGHYYLANDPGLKTEIQYFYAADLGSPPP